MNKPELDAFEVVEVLDEGMEVIIVEVFETVDVRETTELLDTVEFMPWYIVIANMLPQISDEFPLQGRSQVLIGRTSTLLMSIAAPHQHYTIKVSLHTF